MTNPSGPDNALASFGDLLLQPTGSGVADLEIAYEQMELAEGSDPAAGRADGDLDGSSAASGAGEAESEAHPS